MEDPQLEKKEYHSPNLSDYGDIAKITWSRRGGPRLDTGIDPSFQRTDL